jgi:hypothetical protein
VNVKIIIGRFYLTFSRRSIMSKKLICLASFILLLGLVLTSAAKADLVGWWKFDDGQGSVALDSSGRGNHGEIHGGTEWIAGHYGGALRFEGQDGYVDLPIGSLIASMDSTTIATWVHFSNEGGFWQRIFDFGNGPPTYLFLCPRTGTTGPMHIAIQSNDQGHSELNAPDTLPSGWHHVAVVITSGSMQLYLDGLEIDSGNALTVPSDLGNTPNNWLGRSQFAADGYFSGSLDDFRIYDEALSQDEVQAAMEGGVGYPYALSPDPEDGDLLTSFPGGVLGYSIMWKAGDFAVSHDVYFGENFDDVNYGTGDTFRGNQTGTFFLAGYGYTPNDPIPTGFIPGTTYYWRIDEVNDSEPNSPWKGKVWSFEVANTKAYNPTPTDGVQFVNPNADLNWESGVGVVMQTIYFGDDYDTISTATTGGTDLASITTYDPGPLEIDKVYYWRVDSTGPLGQYQGDIWSFRTWPDIPPTSDPNLVGWWKLDEGEGTTALDWSGNSNHGEIHGGTEWVEGYDGGALRLKGQNGYVNLPIGEVIASMDSTTITTWVNFTNTGGSWQRIFDFGSGTSTYIFLCPRMGTSDPMRVATQAGGEGYSEINTTETLPTGWHHVAVVIESGSMEIYLDGLVIASGNAGTVPSALGNTSSNWLGRSQFVADGYFSGSLDDFRIYDYAMLSDEIKDTMRGDPLLAWDPSPANGSTPDIDSAMPLSWSPGDKASMHDVYFGTDEDAVELADTSTAGIYRDRQSGTSYTPPEGVEWGGGPYYWRIDQYNTDETISTGRVWSFTVADFMSIDNIEGYKGGNAPLEENIWFSWHDGVGYGAVGVPPYSPGNGTGSEVGDLTTDSYTEEGIVHGGGQSMPYWYNNNNPIKMKYSEAKMTLSAPRDWTEEDVKALSLWFQGHPGSVGSFTDNLNGTYMMTGSGLDIWNIGPSDGQYHDEFHFAYKTLTGAGTIVARVDSVSETHDWAKAGVMIRETLDANSAHAMMVVTPSSGVSFQLRPSTGAASTSSTTGGITAPHWVRLERDMAGNFTASHSTNGSAWEAIEGAVPESIPMTATVYVGLALTAHNDGNPVPLTCEATFSNVTIAGTVAGQWASQDIGIQSNDDEPMYVAIANNTGPPAVVYHDNQNAAQIDTWTEWNIDLNNFAGINLTDVNSIAIGFGDRNNPQAGGLGKVYFDDIRLYRPRCIPDKVTLSQADLNSDCVVDFRDLEIMADDWLESTAGLAADLNADSTVDFKDYAVLADQWLDEQLWP